MIITQCPDTRRELSIGEDEMKELFKLTAGASLAAGLALAVVVLPLASAHANPTEDPPPVASVDFKKDGTL
jgi:hypothetical protein